MSSLRIDLVCPPFQGHLHPMLGLGRTLAEFAEVRVFTTPDAVPQVARAGLPAVPILAEHVAEIWAIANTSGPVRGRPWRLWQQFQANLRLMPALRADLAAAWHASPPALAIVDFTLPAVGHWAKARGFHWWTSHPSPLAIETPDGTPAYLGGWSPPAGPFGRCRDAVARRAIRAFKRLVFAAQRRPLRALGLSQVYRSDGAEAAYSDELILALGSAGLEFPATWPAALRFFGPVLYSPEPAVCPPADLDPQRPNILVTLGTHLPYARERMTRWVRAWAVLCPDLCFHYTGGGVAPAEVALANVRTYRYLDYASTLAHCAAVVHHGGAGITYHALHAAVPAVVWPQDYDQFDFAARLVWRGLARRCRTPADVPANLRRALGDPALHARLAAFRSALAPVDLRLALLDRLRQHKLLSPA